MALPPLLGLLLGFTTVLSTTVCGQPPVVSIRTQPPEPPFQAATRIYFACDIDSNLEVTYQWKEYCTSQGGTVQVGSHTASLPPGNFSLWIRSTPTICLDLITCTATDSMGATGQSSYQLTPNIITGVGLWESSEPLPTNAAFTADSSGQIGSIACHSAARGSILSQWVGPSGTDITFDLTDAFAIEFHTGSHPSYSSFELNDGESFASDDQGVYSCIIADENGLEHMLNIGIYPNDYSTPVMIPSIQRTSEVPLTINCASTGKPATAVTWSKGSTAIVNDGTYQMSQSISDRRTSSYSNTLTIGGAVEDASGTYRCTVSTDVHNSAPNTSVEIANHYFDLNMVGSNRNITCTIRGAVITNWTDDNHQLVSSADGSSVSLRLKVNDSIHHRVYTCRGYLADLSYRELVVSIIVYVPRTALSVAVSDSGIMEAGEEFSLTCVASTVSGITNTPSLEWLDKEGSPVTTGGLLTVGELTTQTSNVFLSLTFSSLHISHAGQYTCRATLSSPALDTPLEKNTTSDISLQIPEPAIEQSISSSGPVYSGGTVTLTCSIQLSGSVDSPVTVANTWRKDGVTLANSAKTSISQIQQLSSSLYHTTLTVSDLSQSDDAGEYSCEALVAANPSSSYIATSSVASVSLTLTIQQVPPFEVRVDPSSVEGLASDTITLLCTATVHDSVAVPKTFHWSRIVAGGPPTDLSDNGGTVRITNSNLNASTGTSQLVTVEHSPGQYQFVCSVTLQFPGEMGDISIHVAEQTNVTITAVTVSQDESSGDNTGPIVGAVAGMAVLMVVIILVIVFFVFWLWRRGRPGKIDRRRDSMNDNRAHDNVRDYHYPGENVDFENLQQHRHRYRNSDQQVALNERGTADHGQYITMNRADLEIRIPGLNGEERLYAEVREPQLVPQFSPPANAPNHMYVNYST